MNEEIDISRGDMIVKRESLPHIDDSLKAKIIWMDEERLITQKSYLFKMGMQMLSGNFQSIEYKIDINSYEKECADTLVLNDIALCDIAFDKKAIFDMYSDNKSTGSFIIIDKITNNTLGVGMIEALSHKQKKGANEFSTFEIELNALIRKHFPHWESKIIN